jgi:single-strand DNA-binding protein
MHVSRNVLSWHIHPIKKHMSTNNKVQLTGNLGNDPELKTFENGKKVVHFSMATNEDYTNKAGERTRSVQWHNITAWDKLADKLGTQLAKGTSVSVEGKLNTRSYVDKDGANRYITEVVANDVVINKK